MSAPAQLAHGWAERAGRTEQGPVAVEQAGREGADVGGEPGGNAGIDHGGDAVMLDRIGNAIQAVGAGAVATGVAGGVAGQAEVGGRTLEADPRAGVGDRAAFGVGAEPVEGRRRRHREKRELPVEQCDAVAPETECRDIVAEQFTRKGRDADADGGGDRPAVGGDQRVVTAAPFEPDTGGEDRPAARAPRLAVVGGQAGAEEAPGRGGAGEGVDRLEAVAGAGDADGGGVGGGRGGEGCGGGEDHLWFLEEEEEGPSRCPLP